MMETAARAADPILGAIEAHAQAYARLDLGRQDSVCTIEDLAAYSERDEDEVTSRTNLVFTIPTTAAGALAMIAHILHCFRRQRWDDAEMRFVLSNLQKSEPLNPPAAKAAAARDPIFEAIDMHARARADFDEIADNEDGAVERTAEYWRLDAAELAARDRLSLTAPTTAAGAREMIDYTLRSFLGYDGIEPTTAAILSSLLRSPALNPSPAGRKLPRGS